MAADQLVRSSRKAVNGVVSRVSGGRGGYLPVLGALVVLVLMFWVGSARYTSFLSLIHISEPTRPY